MLARTDARFTLAILSHIIKMTPSQIHIEIYKTFYHSIEVLEQRRARVSRWNLAFLVAAVSFGYLFQNSWTLLNVNLLTFLIIFVCIIWSRHIDYFSTIARAKYDAIKEMEKQLSPCPIFHPTKMEWDRIPEGKLKEKGYSYVEKLIPRVVVICVIFYYIILIHGQYLSD